MIDYRAGGAGAGVTVVRPDTAFSAKKALTENDGAAEDVDATEQAPG